MRQNLRASSGDGMAFGMMVGMGETYLPAFILAMGLGEVFAGLVASVPLLAGGLMQLVSPIAVRRLGSHRRWVLICAAIQALSFIPLVIAALVGSIPAWLAMVVATSYWAAGLATGPAWNTWIGTLVPRSVRARYFARRTRLTKFAVLAGFLLGGAALQFGALSGYELEAFAILFAAAAVFRLTSTGFLAMHPEPVRVPVSTLSNSFRLRKLWREFPSNSAARLLTYLVCVQAAVQVAGPYFTPFMLGELQLEYSEFVMLIALSFLAKILALPMWGQVSHRYGAMSLLWIGGLGIVPLPAFWMVSDNLLWLGCSQVFAGVGWAAYELAFFLMFFDSIPEDRRTGVLTLYNVANSAAMVAGALIGAAVLKALAVTEFSYHVIFAGSAMLRVLTLLLLWRVSPMPSVTGTIRIRVLGLRPSLASLDAPVLPGLSDEEAEQQPGLALRDASE